MKQVRKAVIPAAGFGTRFLPWTKSAPKELLPIGNKPVIQYVVEEAVAAGVEEIILVCHPSRTTTVDYFKPNAELRAFLAERGKKKELEELDRVESLARFRVVFQEEPRGLGHAVMCARKEVGDEPFYVMLPDMLVVADVPPPARLMEACSKDDPWAILLERVSASRVSAYGIVRGETSAQGGYRVHGAVEKPKPQDAPSDLGILGRYLFPPRIFTHLEGLEAGSLGEIQLTDAINRLARETPGMGVINEGRIFDVGTPDGLREAYQHYDEVTTKGFLQKGHNVSR